MYQRGDGPSQQLAMFLAKRGDRVSLPQRPVDDGPEKKDKRRTPQTTQQLPLDIGTQLANEFGAVADREQEEPNAKTTYPAEEQDKMNDTGKDEPTFFLLCDF